MLPSAWLGRKSNERTRQFPLLSLFDEMNRLFEDSVPAFKGERINFAPSIDVKETNTEFVVLGEFPGLEPNDVQIELKDNTLTMSGEKRIEHENKEGERVYRERSYGSFARTIPFNVEIDEDRATAEMKNGVLTIKIPKSAKSIKGTKKISVKSA